ncbi:TPR repeat-containing protein [Hathewaya proteolytica DSM 3090]|uniref:TPR repeat-containing protein n=1 Tax=Hathewaya proteolytica DSM 3090 TaxID=1121331 RepID=A0A1M6N521_9CLOT|nr:tetratricopeptide repeat protein [Hathewaya proteolytica]SHJ90752.1 TPR repeat-containing protein [Hathewaya proteolytica DSM 3090]
MKKIDEMLIEAFLLFDEGKKEASLDEFNKIKALITDKQSEEYSKYLMNVGYVYTGLNMFKEAIDAYEELLGLSQNREDEHIALHQLGMVQREAENYETALVYFDKEKDIIEKEFSRDYLKLSINTYEQGYVRFKLGKFQEALQWLEMSLKNALQCDDFIARACAYRGIGEVYAAQGQQEKALDNFRQSKENFINAEDNIGAEEVHELISQL